MSCSDEKKIFVVLILKREGGKVCLVVGSLIFVLF